MVVSSIAENEVKSTVAANIAIDLAERHKKVLLVDGDVGKPAQYKVFEENGKDRISFDQVLRGETAWQEAVHYNERDGIWEMFQFRPMRDAGKLLRENIIAALTEAWKKEMDYIIIDCSPAAVSADAEIWVSAVDSVLLVVREDWADVRVINDAVDMISQNETDFAGFVLNAFHTEWFQPTNMQEYTAVKERVREHGESDKLD